jgi:hypothetical protein
MRWLLFILLPLPLLGAARYEVQWVSVMTNGNMAEVCVTDLGTNATFYHFFRSFTNVVGLNTNILYLPSTTNGLRISVRSQGYDPAGNPTNYTRNVYGTKPARLPYPNDGTNDIRQVQGTNAIFRVFLHDPVFAGDSNLLAWVETGAFATTNAVTNCLAASSLSVSNLSQVPYPVAPIDWAYPPNNRWTNATETLAAIGGGWVPWGWDRGEPLACLWFKLEDEHSNALTNVVASMEIDYGSTCDTALGPFGLYLARFSQSIFTNLDTLAGTAKGYPWIGDASSVVTITNINLCDRLYTYVTRPTCYVARGGSDANGRPTNVPPALVSSGHYFASINGALAAGSGTNNILDGHNDTGGLMVYVAPGITNWTGGTAATGNRPEAWPTILPVPGTHVVLTNRDGDQDIRDLVKISGDGGTMELAFDSTLVPFNGIDHMWWDRVLVNSPGAGPVQNCTNWYITGGSVPQFAQGLGPFSSQSTALRLLRGVDLDGFNHNITFGTMIGCRHPGTNGGNYSLARDGLTLAQTARYAILYNNQLHGFTRNGDCVTAANTLGTTNGAIWIVQNEIEYCANNVSPNLTFLMTYETGGAAHTNGYYCLNADVGKRGGFMYDSGSVAGPSPKVNCFGWDNWKEVSGWKGDNQAGNSDAGSTGGWGPLNQVGWSGNVWLHPEVDNGAGAFFPEFRGLGTSLCLRTNTVDYPRWRDRKAYAGDGVVASGGSDLRLKSDSPGFLNRHSRSYLKFDIARVYRARSPDFDPAGPRVDGNVRKGMFFF